MHPIGMRHLLRLLERHRHQLAAESVRAHLRTVATHAPPPSHHRVSSLSVSSMQAV